MIRRFLLLATAVATTNPSPSGTSAAFAQEVPSVTVVTADDAMRSDHLRMGTATGPGGTIGINNRYLTRDGKPWLPVMGEFHFSRFPARYWEEELLKMKAAGVTVVTSYVLWNQHELSPGQLDWTGDRDIRLFVELCQKHGLLFFLRPGPWVHAESRFGGIPDWVNASTRTRSDDPAYLGEVERFWQALAVQLSGLTWKEGGPIIGVQIENEYNLDGPGRGRQHIATLKKLAVKLGFDVPLYTVTGWDRTIYPKGEVVPIMGGYPDEPWSARTTKLPPKETYLFRFDSRVSGDLGAQTRSRHPGDADADIADTPFLGAEYGGGVPVMYRRRPLLEPADVAASVLTQVGSGVNLLGYYMFHGGANPLANGRGLEETQRSGGYNDVPMIGYDFQAPLGQYGEVNPVSGSLRPLHYFLQSYGDRFAPLSVHRPATVPTGKDDLGALRWSFRGDETGGYLFLNNHVRQYAMPVHKGVRFQVTGPSGPVQFPSRAIDVPDGAYFFWPVGVDFDGLKMAWATAQPITRLEDDGGPIHVLSASLAGKVELAFPASGVSSVSVPTSPDGKGHLIAQVTPSQTQMVAVRTSDGKRIRFLVLDRASAAKAWVGEAFGRRRLILTDADVFFRSSRIALRQRGNADFRFSVWPDDADMVAPGLRKGREGYRIGMDASAVPAIKPTLLRDAGEAPPVEIGGPAKAAMQPLPETHRASAAWSFSIKPALLSGSRDAFLEIDYRGDIARLFDGPTMLDDSFWDGRVWRIGLKRFAERAGRPWTLTVLPFRGDSPVYLDEAVRASVPKEGQVAEVREIRIVPEYEVIIGPK